MIDISMKWGLDCPDCLYLYAPVRGDARYRIFGDRGGANHIDIQVNRGHFAEGSIAAWGTVSSINGLELAVDPGGSFELLLGGAERPGNWLPLAPDARFVLVRQYFNDWEAERPADLLIERLASPAPAPPLRTDQLADRFALLGRWLERGGALWEQMSRSALDLPANSLVVYRAEDAAERAGLRGQAYGIGNFQCAPDQAVIVEFTPPPCRHWNLALADWYWQSFDFVTRQTSLNAHQASLDPDGVLRAVIAHHDPGVPNWLDAAGHTRGTITARFLLADQSAEPRLRVVKRADLRSELPAATPAVTPEERARVLERRRRAALRRYRR
jgi:hypothetical protein